MQIVDEMLKISFVGKAFILLLFYLTDSAMVTVQISEVASIKITHWTVFFRKFVSIDGLEGNFNDIQIGEKNVTKIAIKHVNIHDILKGCVFKEMIMIT